MAEALKYTCSICGEVHEGLPDFACSAPTYYDWVPEQERARRCFLTSDFCVIDEQDYFVRAVLYVPINGTDESFGWGVWTSLSQKNFNRYGKLWDAEDVSEEGPYFGWLSNRLPIYPDTLGLKVKAHLRNEGLRPLLELEPTDHPLAVDQREGIAWNRAVDIVARLMHSDPGKISEAS